MLQLLFFFFNDTATTEIYTLSLHDALPISGEVRGATGHVDLPVRARGPGRRDRKSTRLNSSHRTISYAVFCLKKKKYQEQPSAYNGQTKYEEQRQTSYDEPQQPAYDDQYFAPNGGPPFFF